MHKYKMRSVRLENLILKHQRLRLMMRQRLRRILDYAEEAVVQGLNVSPGLWVESLRQYEQLRRDYDESAREIQMRYRGLMDGEEND